MYSSPFYHNYRQDITFNHKSKRTTLVIVVHRSQGVQDHGSLGFLLEVGKHGKIDLVGTNALRCKIPTLKDFLTILVESCNKWMCEVAKCNPPSGSHLVVIQSIRFRDPFLHPGSIKPCKYWDKPNLPQLLYPDFSHQRNWKESSKLKEKTSSQPAL